MDFFEHVGKSFKLGHRKALLSLGVISTFFRKSLTWTTLVLMKKGFLFTITSDCGLHNVIIIMQFVSYAKKCSMSQKKKPNLKPPNLN